METEVVALVRIDAMRCWTYWLQFWAVLKHLFNSEQPVKHFASNKGKWISSLRAENSDESCGCGWQDQNLNAGYLLWVRSLIDSVGSPWWLSWTLRTISWLVHPLEEMIFIGGDHWVPVVVFSHQVTIKKDSPKSWHSCKEWEKPLKHSHKILIHKLDPAAPGGISTNSFCDTFPSLSSSDQFFNYFLYFYLPFFPPSFP